MAHYLSKHFIFSLKLDILQSFHILFCIGSSVASSTFAQRIPQNITDVEFENFGAKNFGFSL